MVFLLKRLFPMFSWKLMPQSNMLRVVDNFLLFPQGDPSIQNDSSLWETCEKQMQIPPFSRKYSFLLAPCLAPEWTKPLLLQIVCPTVVSIPLGTTASLNSSMPYWHLSQLWLSTNNNIFLSIKAHAESYYTQYSAISVLLNKLYKINFWV